MRKKAQRRQTRPRASFVKVLGIVLLFALLIFLGTTGFSGRAVSDSQGFKGEIITTPSCGEMDSMTDDTGYLLQAPSRKVGWDVFNELMAQVIQQEGCNQEQSWCSKAMNGEVLPHKGFPDGITISIECPEQASSILAACESEELNACPLPAQ